MDLKFSIYYHITMTDLKQQKWIANLTKHETSLIFKPWKITKLDIEYGDWESNKRKRNMDQNQSKKTHVHYIYFSTDTTI